MSVVLSSIKAKNVRKRHRYETWPIAQSSHSHTAFMQAITHHHKIYAVTQQFHSCQTAVTQQSHSSHTAVTQQSYRSSTAVPQRLHHEKKTVIQRNSECNSSKDQVNNKTWQVDRALVSASNSDWKEKLNEYFSKYSSKHNLILD